MNLIPAMKPEIKLYNTLSRQAEVFAPLDPPHVRLYVCGPTVYDDAHLGHARCYITWDVLYRFLTLMGYDVNYTRNITDVDDKIINRAKENGEDPQALAGRYTQKFHAVMDRLHVAHPSNEPRATQYVPQMITFVEKLINKGFAYTTPSGTVYYDTGKKGNYGNLCHQNLEDLQSGARVDVDPEKRSPLDFALWKPAPAEESPVWDSPWGPGRPGWHLECSAMSYSILGEQLDIHAGGMDLIFPHHQNEIAQSEAFTGKEPFVRIWMHNGFVNVSGEKMSKSLGNFSTIEKLLEVYDANTLRYFILTHHYRSPVDFNDGALEGARNRTTKMRQNVQDLLNTLDGSADATYQTIQKRIGEGFANPTEWEMPVQAWVSAMADDMNTAQALAQINELLTMANTERLSQANREAAFWAFIILSEQLGFDFRDMGEVSPLADLYDQLARLLATVGQTLQQEKGWEPVVVSSESSSEDLLTRLLEVRAQVRAEKDWAMSDRIRDQLAVMGIHIKDRKEGLPLWHYEPVRAGSAS